MDLTRIIQQLHAERHRVRQAIAVLEQFQQERNTAVPSHGKRGRKSIGAEERKVVAERMKSAIYRKFVRNQTCMGCLEELALPRSLQSCGHLRGACTLVLRDDKFVRGRRGAVLSRNR